MILWWHRINIGALIFPFNHCLANLTIFSFIALAHYNSSSFCNYSLSLFRLLFVCLEFFRIKTEDDDLYEVVMKALETLLGDEDQDVRYFAGQVF